MRKLFLSLFALIIILFCTSLAYSYKPQEGDLLFQDLNCGSLRNAITGVTVGYGDTQVSHVGMVVIIENKPLIIEAIDKDVRLTTLQHFLNRSVDKAHNPRVMVGRLKESYRHLIPSAVEHAKIWLHRPYNQSFAFNNNFKTFYCSQLIYDAFMKANANQPIFHLNTMTFRKAGKVLPEWESYFKRIGEPIPEGEKGTNPGMMSRSAKIKIIYYYGNLRASNLSA